MICGQKEFFGIKAPPQKLLRICFWTYICFPCFQIQKNVLSRTGVYTETAISTLFWAQTCADRLESCITWWYMIPSARRKFEALSKFPEGFGYLGRSILVNGILYFGLFGHLDMTSSKYQKVKITWNHLSHDDRDWGRSILVKGIVYFRLFGHLDIYIGHFSKELRKKLKNKDFHLVCIKLYRRVQNDVSWCFHHILSLGTVWCRNLTFLRF